MTRRLHRPRRLLAGVIAAGAAAALLTTLPAVAVPHTGPAARAVAGDPTSAREKARVDAVPTPELDWYECQWAPQCATVDLPLDYDEPKGATVELALARRPADDQKNKIGTLFVNPGGPGGSATELVNSADFAFSPTLLSKFDIVGVDPRGVGSSDQVKCFASDREQKLAYQGLGVPFPVSRAEQTAYLAASARVATGCSTTGRPLSASMSTAEDARDMDVIRRAVGDKKLTYLGFSYGTYLGQVYANLFPDRVRALVIDGVLDPVAWAGTASTAGVPQTERLRSGEGASKALKEILKRCNAAGPEKCVFASKSGVDRFRIVANRLKAKPYVEKDPDTGRPTAFTYADFIALVQSALYDEYGYEEIVGAAQDLAVLTRPAKKTTVKAAGASTASRSLARRITRVESQIKERKPGSPHFAFPYDNAQESFSSVLCSDGLNPSAGSAWRTAVAGSEQRAPYFGPSWLWSSAVCAGDRWKAADEDAYRGPFTATTSSPVLVVGSLWDPATNYKGAQKAAALLPNSRLLTSDNWGHTAYGTSPCVNGAIDSYLVKQTVPAKGATCKSAVQPFVG